MRKHLLIMLVVVLMLAFGPAGLAMSSETAEVGPVDLEGVLQGAPYKIRVPEDWNGVLLLYAHGYTTAPVEVPDVAFLGEDMLLDEGYALAASAFQGTGWNVEEGIWDTKSLLGIFEKEVGVPDHVILYGPSMGGMVTLASIEKYPNRYSAAIPMCTSAGGAPMVFDHKLDFALAYDIAFGWPEGWGSVNDVRDDINFWHDVWPKVFGELMDPANTPKWEFVRRVTDTSLGGYYVYDGPVSMPPGRIAMTYFITQQRADLEVRAGGRLAQNIDRVYGLSTEDQVFFESAGLPVEAWLAEMNARDIYEADPNARAYLEKYVAPSGHVKVPVLMVHNVEDSITDVAHAAAYLRTLQDAGNDDLLVPVYSVLPGHCNFTEAQMLVLFEATVDWLETGTPPTQEDFPAALDFVPGFEPEP